MTNLEHYDFCKPYIMDDEYILWEGAPEKGVSLTSRDIVLLPFSVIWLGFALFWEYLAVTTSGSLLMVVWGLPFIGIGLYLLFGRFLQTEGVMNTEIRNFCESNRKLCASVSLCAK